MITGKGKKLIVLACSLVLIFGLISCVNNDVSNDILEDLISKDEINDGQYQENYAAASLYRIVLPESATSELVSAAEELKSKLTRATSIDAELVYDYETLSNIDGVVEILLGKTSRVESAQVLKGLRDKDYVFKWYGEKLIVGGVSHDATIDAVTRFCEEILPISTVAVLMSEDQEIIFEGEYETDKIKLNGFELYEYQIIYASGKQSIAKELAEEIRVKSGYVLNVVGVNQYVGGKYISVGADPNGEISADKDTAVVAARNNDLYLLGSGDNELNAAVARFSEMLFSDTSLILDDGYDEIIRFNYPEIYFQTLFCETGGTPTISQINNVTALVDSFDSAFVLLTEVDNDLFDRVAFGMSSFDYIKISIAQSTSLPILYDPSKVTLVGRASQETFVGGKMVYGEFRLGAGKDSFLVINCYCAGVVPFDDIVSKIESVADEKELPFIVMLSTASSGKDVPDFSGEAECVVNRFSRYGYAIYASDDFSAAANTEGVLTNSYGAYYEEIKIKKIK